ncbi:MAG: hypothetical protein JXA99_12910 [Candidatus Lokiarchaeota archaeon]|nr:hypothetical protein [Candidatus Lokiarchaeota archaeon]
MPSLQIVHQELDYTDYIKSIQEISKIIKTEKIQDPNRRIFINIGTGSKIIAIASTEASRLWNCELLYLYSTKYDPFNSGAMHKGEFLFQTPKIFPLQKPNSDLINILKIIYEMIITKYNINKIEKLHQFIYKKDLLNVLVERKILRLKARHENPRFKQSSF